MNALQTGQGIYDNNFKKSQYKFGTQASGLFALHFKYNRLKVTTNSLFIKATENQIQDQVGYTRSQVQNPNELIRLNQYDESNYLLIKFNLNIKLQKMENIL